jgi:hypothetical protein
LATIRLQPTATFNLNSDSVNPALSLSFIARAPNSTLHLLLGSISLDRAPIPPPLFLFFLSFANSLSPPRSHLYSLSLSLCNERTSASPHPDRRLLPLALSFQTITSAQPLVYCDPSSSVDYVRLPSLSPIIVVLHQP